MTGSQMHKGWPSIRLGDVTSIGAGAGFPKKWQGSTEGQYPFYKVSDMNLLGNEVWMKAHNNAIDESTRAQLKATSHPEGTIIFPKIGAAIATNKKRILTKASCFDNNVIGIHPSSEFDTAFLFHMLLCKNLSEFANTGNPPSIRKTTLENWEIPLPPLEEQTRIARILDAADALRAKRRESLAQLDTLLQSTFLDMFGDPVTNPMGWVRTKLIDLCDVARGISYGVVQRGDHDPDGIPLIRIRDILKGDIDSEQLVRCSGDIVSKYKRTVLCGGELVISIRGTIGRSARVPSDLKGGNITRELALIPLSPDVVWAFTLELIRTDAVFRRLAEDVKGIAQRGINLRDLRELAVIQPPLEFQYRFAAIVQSVERQKATQRAHLEELDTLFASLQSRAFRGEL